MNQTPQIVYELTKLIDASRMLSDRQKEILTSKVTELDLSTQLKLKDTFLQEQKVMIEYYKDISQIEKRGAEKKIKIIYDYAEQMVKKVEVDELESLEKELAELEQ